MSKIHYKTEIKLDIFSDLTKEAPSLMADTLKKVWQETYLSDLDVEDYIDLATDLWIRYYITTATTIEAIEKIKQADPPKDLKIYLIFNLFDDDDGLIIDYSEMKTIPLFRAYLPTKDLFDTYAYNSDAKKFDSLEIIEPSYLSEIKSSMTVQEKMNFDELILKSYGFHQKLLGMTPKKILLYTAQPPDTINEWNKKGTIPKSVYFTDKMSRAEYFFEIGDIIVDYRIPEDKVVMTSDFGGAKEFVTIENVPIT